MGMDKIVHLLPLPKASIYLLDLQKRLPKLVRCSTKAADTKRTETNRFVDGEAHTMRLFAVDDRAKA